MSLAKKRIYTIISIMLIFVMLGMLKCSNTVYAQTNSNQNTAEQEKHNKNTEAKMKVVEKTINQLKLYYITKDLLVKDPNNVVDLESITGEECSLEDVDSKIENLENKLLKLGVERLTSKEAKNYSLTEAQDNNSIDIMTIEPYPDTAYEHFYMSRWITYSDGVGYNVDMMYAIPTSTASSLSRSENTATLYSGKSYLYSSIGNKLLEIYSDKLIGSAFSAMGPIIAWSPYELFLEDDNKIVNNKLTLVYLDSMTMCYHYVKKLSQSDYYYRLALTTNSIDISFMAYSAGINEYGKIVTDTSGWKTSTLKTSVFGSYNDAVIAYKQDRGILHSCIDEYTFYGPNRETQLGISIYVPLSPAMIK